MTAITAPLGGRVVRDARTVGRQLGYEQRAFWRTPQQAVFTFALPILLLLVFGAVYKNVKIGQLGGISGVQYFIPSMLAYGAMSSCFMNLGINICFRREMGLLKRVRGTPIAPWQYLAGIVANAGAIVAVQTLIAIVVGKFAYSVHLPQHWFAFLLALVVGSATFCILGLAVSCFVPNADAAPAILNLPFFALMFVSGIYYPWKPGSAIAQIANYFPVARFKNALFAPFNTLPGTSPWAWRDLLVMAVWAGAGALIIARRFTWEPTKS